LKTIWKTTLKRIRKKDPKQWFDILLDIALNNFIPTPLNQVLSLILKYLLDFLIKATRKSIASRRRRKRRSSSAGIFRGLLKKLEKAFNDCPDSVQLLNWSNNSAKNPKKNPKKERNSTTSSNLLSGDTKCFKRPLKKTIKAVVKNGLKAAIKRIRVKGPKLFLIVLEIALDIMLPIPLSCILAFSVKILIKAIRKRMASRRKWIISASRAGCFWRFLETLKNKAKKSPEVVQLIGWSKKSSS